MRKCEFIGAYDKRTRSHIPCDKAAYYEWRLKGKGYWMCKEHGEALAGNYTHELYPIFKRGALQKIGQGK